MLMHAPSHSRSRKAVNQAGYRHRQGRLEIAPNVRIGPRVIELLIEMSVEYDGLSQDAAEAKSRDRAWVVEELEKLHEKLADDWGIPRYR